MNGRTEGAGEIGKGSVHEAGLKRKGAGSGKREKEEQSHNITLYFAVRQEPTKMEREQGFKCTGSGK